MNNHAALTSELNEVSRELNTLLRSISTEQLDQVPFEHSWTAGQLAEHLLKSAGSAADLLRGNVTDAHRAPDEHIALLRRIFLDFSTRLQSPKSVEPVEHIHPKEGLINSLGNAYESICSSTKVLDLSALCLDREFPNTGLLTRFEWCSFILFHTQRHLHQLKNIIHHLGVTSAPYAGA